MAGIVRVRGIALGGVCAVAIAAGPATAATRIRPYIEVQQVLNVALDDGGETLTYTALAAGVDGSVNSRRVQATINYRYERRFPWNDNLGDQNIHTGLARGSLQLVPNMLTLEAGAIATRTRTDIRGAAPVFLTGDNANITQIYGGYVGPTLNTRVGQLQVGAGYQLGYVRAGSDTGLFLPAGQPQLDRYDDATSQTAIASVGMPTGSGLPFGWTISGGYQREDAGQLDQRFVSRNVRGELIVPVSPTLALTGSAGYEAIEQGQRAPLRDAAGVPVVDRKGRYVTDRSSPRLLAYDQSGLIYDAGVIWRPNRRTTLIAKAGHRYGGTTVTGSLQWRMSEKSGLQVVVYDGIQSFGRLLTQNLNALPTDFLLPVNPLIGNLGGCVFGTTPGTGGCLNDVFQSLNTANFRNRGVTALYSVASGRWTFGLGGGYSQRRYFAPIQASAFSLDGVTDESWIVQGDAARQLSANSGINAALFAQWYKSGIAGADSVSATGATAAYYHTFGPRLTGQASAGIYTYDQDSFDNTVSGQFLLGMRYQF